MLTPLLQPFLNRPRTYIIRFSSLKFLKKNLSLSPKSVCPLDNQTPERRGYRQIKDLYTSVDFIGSYRPTGRGGGIVRNDGHFGLFSQNGRIMSILWSFRPKQVFPRHRIAREKIQTLTFTDCFHICIYIYMTFQYPCRRSVLSSTSYGIRSFLRVVMGHFIVRGLGSSKIQTSSTGFCRRTYAYDEMWLFYRLLRRNRIFCISLLFYVSPISCRSSRSELRSYSSAIIGSCATFYYRKIRLLMC